MSDTFDDRMQEFPCSFNLSDVSKVSSQRLKLIKYNVTNDFSLDCCEEENIRNKNLLTWILFKLDEKKEAFAFNTEVLKLTKRRNITALGNLVFMFRNRGYCLRSETTIFQELVDLKEDKEYKQLRCNAVAEQAYSYGRLGALKYQQQSAKLFEECIEKCPENYIWKFGLGLVYRRLTNYNLHCSISETIDVSDLSLKCTKLLFEVGQKGNDRFKGLAYSQLVCLRQHMRGREYNEKFNNLNIWKLCEKALEYGSRNPTVLTQCGKSFKSIDIDKAINLLRQSVKLQNNNVNYHHLGLSLVKKAHLIAIGKYSCRESNPKSRRRLTFEPSPSDNYGKVKPTEETSSCAVSEHYQVFQDSGFSSGSNMEENVVGDATREIGHQNPNSTIYPNQRFSNNFETEKRFNPESGNQTISLAANKNRTRPSLKNSLLLPSRQKSPENVPKDIKTRGKHHFKSSRSEDKSRSPFDNQSLKPYAVSPITCNDINNEHVKEAIECYEKSIEISHEENLPAKVSLADIFFKTGHYEEALANYNQIIDQITSDNLITLITAHEYAGKSLQKLNEHSKAKMHFTKAISLAADMALNNPQFKNCETQVWDSFITMMEMTENMDSPQEKNKQKLKLLELVRNYKDIVGVVKDLAKRRELDGESFVTGLRSYIILEDFEEAILFLNMASTNKDLTQSESWLHHDVMDMRWKTYIGVSWSRLLKGCSDYRRVLQQMFQLKYGQCSGMISGEEEYVDTGQCSGMASRKQDNVDTEKHDVLIVNDESADHEDGLGATSLLARTLYSICLEEFGLDCFRNLMNNPTFGKSTEEIQLKEIESYSSVLLILGDNDLEPYNRMLEAVHFTTGPKVLVVNMRERKDVPLILQRCPFLNINNDSFMAAVLQKDFHLDLKRELQRRSGHAEIQCSESISTTSQDGHCNEPKSEHFVESLCNKQDSQHSVEGQCNEPNSENSAKGQREEPNRQHSVKCQSDEPDRQHPVQCHSDKPNRQQSVECQLNEKNKENIEGVECMQACSENPALEPYSKEASSKEVVHQHNESNGQEPRNTNKKDTLFSKDIESLMRFFCFLVQENFDDYLKIFKTKNLKK